MVTDDNAPEESQGDDDDQTSSGSHRTGARPPDDVIQMMDFNNGHFVVDTIKWNDQGRQLANIPTAMVDLTQHSPTADQLPPIRALTEAEANAYCNVYLESPDAQEFSECPPLTETERNAVNRFLPTGYFSRIRGAQVIPDIATLLLGDLATAHEQDSDEVRASMQWHREAYRNTNVSGAVGSADLANHLKDTTSPSIRSLLVSPSC